MNLLREISGLGNRPYPLDRERQWRVLAALVEHKMNISGLAKALNMSQPLISMVVSGRRLSEKTERRIAEYLGKPADYLFPSRTPEEIRRMRQAEQAAKEKAA